MTDGQQSNVLVGCASEIPPQALFMRRYFPANIHSITRVFHIAPLCKDSLSILRSARECEWLPLEKSVGSMRTISPSLDVWTGAAQWAITGKQ